MATSATDPNLEDPLTGSEPLPDTSPQIVSQSPESGSRLTRFKAFLGAHRLWVIVIVAVLIIAPAAAWAYVQYSAKNKPITSVAQTKKAVKAPPPKTTKASPLTGVEVDPALANRAIRAVVIENHPDARPQSGLSQAGVVYEALAEGGITRFLAFFLDNQPPSIGPVRSLRPYFNDWALEFNSPIMHAGGSAEALGQVATLKVKSVNALGAASQYFTRASDRQAPHNLYTSSASLDQLLQANNYAQPAQFVPNLYKKDEPPTTPAHTVISINYSYNGFQVEYHYNHGCNCYDRFLAGAPHVDRNSGAQIQVKNVVVEYMPVSYDSTGHAIFGLLGSGKTVVFRDGGAVEGTWNKAAYEQRTKLLDATGKEIPLDKGNTWYAIVPSDRPVSY